MKFSIVTPVFNGLPWMEYCVKSVKDQQFPEVEHIIQDGGSTDGTVDYCNLQEGLRLTTGKDEGMYDAINKGIRSSQGDIILQLNCDEQLLPGALKPVEEYFAVRPEVEMAFAYALILDRNGKLLSYRKTLLPTLLHTQISHLTTLTCATFFRRGVFEKYGLYFDKSYRCIGDGEQICRAIRKQVRMGIIPVFTSAYTITGNNLSNKCAQSERERLASEAPWLLRKTKPLVKLIHRIKRTLGGVYTQGPLDYEVYTPQSPDRRVHFHVEKPDFRWRETAESN